MKVGTGFPICFFPAPRLTSLSGKVSQIKHMFPDGLLAWKWTRQQVIDSINSGSNTFYTQVNGRRADIAVVDGQNGQYLRTHADGQWNDNLLALAECG
jgi:hypothetical protein